MKAEHCRLIVLGFSLLVYITNAQHAATLNVADVRDYTGQTIMTFNFNLVQFSQFYNCLCNPAMFCCQASLPTNAMGMIIYEHPIRSDTWPEMVRYYVCEGSITGLMCCRKPEFERQSYQASGMRFFKLTGHSYCGIDCIGLMFTFEGELFSYDHDLLNLETCNANYYMSKLSIRNTSLGPAWLK